MPNSSVALNSLVPASRLTSVAAVLKASSIPSERQMQLNSAMTLKSSLPVGNVSVRGPYLGRWACRRFWTRWPCKRSRTSAFASGFHSHK